MQITLAKTAGFCFGVNRAINKVYSLLEEGKKVCTLGPIIHNPQMVEQLQQRGVRIIHSPTEAEPDETVVIRSHGVDASTFEMLEMANIQYCDATCPFVAKIHRIVAEKSAQGYFVIVAGDAGHPETKGIMGHCSGPVFVVSTPEDIENIAKENKNLFSKPAIMVSQTTFNTQMWKKCIKTAKKVYTNLSVFDTICSATEERQNEALGLSKASDVMLVIGGRESSNTAKLKQVCQQNCTTYLIETATELKPEMFAGYHKIGVTAGASTPAVIIKEVLQTMNENEKVNNETEDINFAEALESSLKTIYSGEKVMGYVTAITPTEVQVEIGTKHMGYIPLSELSDDPTVKPEDVVKKGDEIELLVRKVSDSEGTVELSKKRLDAIKGQEIIEAAAKDETVLDGVVTDVVKGGVIVTSHGATVFIPASQATASRNDKLEDLLKQRVQFKILEISERGRRRRAVGSIRAVLQQARKAAEEKIWADIAVGKTYTGEVKSLTSYGAFVDLGGVDGMIHISELSWNRIKHPSEVVNVGDKVEVYVKDLNPETKKISLGYKKTEENPWVIFQNQYSVGSTVEATIVSMTSFGAFAQIIPGIDGLIHISQISTERIEKPSDILEIGQKVTAKITDIDEERKRISLSIKALIEEKEAAEVQQEPVGADEVVASTDNMEALADAPGEE